MNTTVVAMSLISFVVVMGTWISYLVKIPGNKVPVRPVGSVFLQSAGVILAIIAIFWPNTDSGLLGVVVIIPAVFALVMGLFFLWLLTQRKTPVGHLKVKVGKKILPFVAMTSEGQQFHTNELANRRIVLKFFRGGW